tara:strand:- start:7 stop:846 length:840 start_codon:yes stop_codon:yes gene_type:complete
MKKKLIKSYAKINLCLNILGKNKKKLHKIQSIISFLNLYDRIYIEPTNKKKHIIEFNGPFSKNLKNNTISHLLSILDKKKLLNKNYKIQIKKNIPQQSGLGGGSMNAASILGYFIKKKILHLSKKETFKICNKIGSDVFLGLDNRNSILIGNTKIYKYNKKLDLFVVLIKPKIGCSTKDIYKEVKNFSKNRIKVSSKVFKIDSLANFQNDLEKPAFKLYPILRKLKIFMSKIDQVKFVRMTGSGSTIVAYFSNKKSAINALKLVKKDFKNYWSILSKTI